VIIIYRDKQKNSEIMEIYSLQVDTLQSSVTLKNLIYESIKVSKLTNSKFRIEVDIPNHDPNGPNVFQWIRRVRR